DMVFLTCGLGGGTGTGAVGEVAKLAKDIGALTVAVVTKPFAFEGAQRRRIAEEGFNQLIQYVDTVITIPNDRVLQIIDKKTSLIDAFNIVDDVLRQGVQGISELITIPGLINVDFADVKAIMENAGSALMGIGRASGENRAVEAAKQAIASPLLELSVDGAKGILFTITGGHDLGMHEVAEAAKVVTGSADEDAKIIFGAIIDEDLKEEVRITVVATGFDHHERRRGSGSVEVPVQGTWTPSAFLRVREEEERKERIRPTISSSTPLSSSVSSVSSISLKPRPIFEEARPISTSQAVVHSSPPPSMPKLAPKVQPPPTEEEELEIPAFIRKKMM
ncbi:TPA: cell division protein FtsZ, partial [Candidatus Uhrbacteria bacterium]|nr:cell division protein FtsZ [Candidatus Uhrbacteria bacterium]